MTERSEKTIMPNKGKFASIKVKVTMPYDDHCDGCSEYNEDGRWCRLFGEPTLTCDCGSPGRLLECRNGECDGPCPDCKGHGERYLLKPPSYDKTITERCERCGGTGRV